MPFELINVRFSVCVTRRIADLGATANAVKEHYRAYFPEAGGVARRRHRVRRPGAGRASRRRAHDDVELGARERQRPCQTRSWPNITALWRWSDRFARLFIECTQIADSRGVLDVGCGLGTPVMTVKDTVIDNRVVGIDCGAICDVGIWRTSGERGRLDEIDRTVQSAGG